MSMTQQVSAKHQRVLLWMFTISLIVSLVIGLGSAHYVPQPNNSMSVGEIAGLYRDHVDVYRFVFMINMFAGGFYFCYTAVISAQLRRIEGSVGRVLNYTQLSTGAANGVLLMLPSLLFTAAAFRPDRNPEITVALHDLANIVVLMPIASFTVQQIAIAWAIFSDTSARPVFARWVGHVNLWTGIIYVPAFAMSFFKTGPLSFDGVVAFTIPVIAYLLWYVVMIIVLFKAIRQEADGTNAALAPA
jgi:hypothetical protein